MFSGLQDSIVAPCPVPLHEVDLRRGAYSTSFALADCNNFFVSCERVFCPKLNHRPVVVLSNNDGCVIARSNEVKALGVPMGIPFFKIRDMIKRHNIAVFSSNYALYQDMSNRVMSILQQFVPRSEPYSIDEIFLDLSAIDPKERRDYALTIQKTVEQFTGIPMSIGLGSTKTLAKLANAQAKKSSAIVNTDDIPHLEDFLNTITIEDVWGVGRNLGQRLRAWGIGNAGDFYRADESLLKQHFNIVTRRIACELRGQSCWPLHHSPEETTDLEQRKTVRVSRLFRRPTDDSDIMREAMASFASQACVRLRQHRMCTRSLLIWALPARASLSLHAHSLFIPLGLATDDTRIIIASALDGLTQILRPGEVYRKVGVVLQELTHRDHLQSALLDPSSPHLMTMLDRINARWGRDTVKFASLGVRPEEFRPSADYVSPRYTTVLEDIPKVQ